MPEVLKKVPSGVRGIDEITYGGLPKGRTTLLCGGPGCGKTLLATIFLKSGALDYAEPGVFISFDERPADLSVNSASLGIDLEDLQKRNLLVIDHVHLERQEIHETGEYDLEGLFVRLNHAVKKIGARRVVLDSIDTLFAGIPNTAIVRSELRRLFDWLKDHDLTAVITAERGPEGNLTRHGIEEYVSDCVIELDHRFVNNLSTRRLRVVKYRGSPHGADEYPFLIDDRNIVLMPVTSLGLTHRSSDERVSMGIAGLDAMLEDKGVFRGSSILISGGPGAGKTSIAAHLVDAGCRRGERCTYFSFEESPPQLTRNMRSIGIDLQPWINKKLLHCISERPSMQGLEMHLSKMLKEVREFDPAIVVVDPLSALLSISSGNQMHVMVLRLVDYLKSQGVTAMFISLQDGAKDRTELHISSNMDTWIVVGGERTDNDLIRHLRIVKSRGMAHSTRLGQMTFTNNGVQVTPLQGIRQGE